LGLRVRYPEVLAIHRGAAVNRGRLETLSNVLHASVLIKLGAGLLLHAYTVWLSFVNSGTIAAVVTFVLPGIAEIFWIGKFVADGQIAWLYLLVACVGYIALLLYLTPLLRRAIMSEIDQ
jgi:hypothetical protein